eukprot:TRINITY_DN6706_c0_g1_i2.p1 TRINITY_DN6706_c0_g1~~TRINITY_DN6706_c0_g1_i2.p1  ORF type:complete len:223 (+),score=44.87 TRINITY_DN6706_c0_g1_i2:150-818(+)
MRGLSWHDVRGLFRRTRVVERHGALKYTLPKRYLKAPNDEVKLVWDVPTAAEFFGSQKHTNHMVWIMILQMLTVFWFVPIKYTLGDFIDSIKPYLSDITASNAYSMFVLEMAMQRNRAYEFMRFQGRPGLGANQGGHGSRLSIATGSQSGMQAWDVDSGRPHGTFEGYARLENFLNNPKLEAKYHAETKADMEKIRELRAQLADIRSQMTEAKQDMYRKAME